MSRLDELKEKESLSEEEQAELTKLETEAAAAAAAASEGDDDPDPDKDAAEFDDAFDKAIADDIPATDDKTDLDKAKDKGEDKKDLDKDKKKDPDPTSIFVAPEPDKVKDKDKDKDGDDKTGDVDWEAKATELETARAADTQKMKSWEGRISAANKRADEAEEKLQKATDSTQDKGADKKDKKTDLPGGEEDDQILKDFVVEFPSLEKPIKAMAMKIANQVIGDRLKDIEPQLKKIETIEETQVAQTTDDHFSAIEEAHSDFREIRDTGKLKTWIEAQPTYLQKALNDVAEKGSSEDVIEMFDSYKTSIGEVTSSSTKEGEKDNKKEKKDKKAQDLMAVDGSTGGPGKGKTKIGKEDFDSAWDDALSTD